ncbi:hypothetical protein [Streptomyces sp. NPDC054863]
MAALVWLLIPVVATIGATIWSWCAGHSRPADIWTDAERYDRLRASFADLASARPDAR